MKQKCYVLQQQFVALQGVKLANYLQANANTHDSSSTLATGVTKLEATLKVAEKCYQDTSDVVEEKTCQAEEDRTTFLQEAKAHSKTLKALEDEVIGMRKALHDSF